MCYNKPKGKFYEIKSYFINNWICCLYSYSDFRDCFGCDWWFCEQEIKEIHLIMGLIYVFLGIDDIVFKFIFV